MRRTRRIPMRLPVLLLLAAPALPASGRAPVLAQAPAPAPSPGSPATRTTIGSVERLDPRMDRVVPANAELEVLSEGHLWVEGPLWVPELGGVLFSDTRRNTIYLWQEGEGTRVWLEPSGYTGTTPRGGEPGSNGLALDRQGRLLIAQHGDRRVARLDAPLTAPAPRFVTVAGSFEGRRLNSPNDIAVRSSGEVYFTDPPYGLEGGVNDPARELEVYGVYRVRTDGTVERLVDDIARPNGIVFSPDERILYLSSSGGTPPAIRAFDVTRTGPSRTGGSLPPRSATGSRWTRPGTCTWEGWPRPSPCTRPTGPGSGSSARGTAPRTPPSEVRTGPLSSSRPGRGFCASGYPFAGWASSRRRRSSIERATKSAFATTGSRWRFSV